MCVLLTDRLTCLGDGRMCLLTPRPPYIHVLTLCFHHLHFLTIHVAVNRGLIIVQISEDWFDDTQIEIPPIQSEKCWSHFNLWQSWDFVNGEEEKKEFWHLDIQRGIMQSMCFWMDMLKITTKRWRSTCWWKSVAKSLGNAFKETDVGLVMWPTKPEHNGWDIIHNGAINDFCPSHVLRTEVKL